MCERLDRRETLEAFAIGHLDYFCGEASIVQRSQENLAPSAAHWSYDDRTRQLRLRYVASRRADTVLVLPRALYPDGAGVEVLGGRGETTTDVRSGFALIRAAGRVSVRVAPR